MTRAPMVYTDNLAIGYPRGAGVIADRLNLNLYAGELVCLLGVNGAGKSTLMRTFAGMQAPLSGEVYVDGLRVRGGAPAELARKVSIVLTDKLDAAMLTARDLVALGRFPYTDWIGRLKPDDVEAVRKAIRDVSADSLADRRVSDLSDGERQKIMIARALAQDTPVMILDEPTAFLDLPRRAEIMQMLRRLAHTLDRAVLLSTHDLDLALRCADRLWLMHEDGHIDVGAPEDLVLSGAFEMAFAHSGMQFDAAVGMFRGDSIAVGRVRLTGEGIRVLWTRRALERADYLIDSAAANEIVVSDTGWSGQINGESVTWGSLGDLVAWLRDQKRSPVGAQHAAPLPIEHQVR